MRPRRRQSARPKRSKLGEAIDTIGTESRSRTGSTEGFSRARALSSSSSTRRGEDRDHRHFSAGVEPRATFSPCKKKQRSQICTPQKRKRLNSVGFRRNALRVRPPDFWKLHDANAVDSPSVSRKSCSGVIDGVKWAASSGLTHSDDVVPYHPYIHGQVLYRALIWKSDEKGEIGDRTTYITAQSFIDGHATSKTRVLCDRSTNYSEILKLITCLQADDGAYLMNPYSHDSLSGPVTAFFTQRFESAVLW
ncbi:hypothetical protein KIN20_028492 [Parelaphostrongylus tenuis]|uniref:Uncharacterized protein n=1 Tax=Parelaphostrongylus tenuis TaxID=148309 RepID=A0AAD5R186_PARTN|nr:hypothetical protein KIN20_028492 [Parelaphostrongylus tenuis]